MNRAPAFVPALVFAAGIALGHALAPRLPVGHLALLVLAGIARGGGWGRAVAWAAAGALVAGLGVQVEPPDSWRGRIVEAAGRVCGLPVEQRYGVAVPLCGAGLRAGSRLVAGPTRLRLELPAGVAPPLPGSRVRARGSLRRSAGFANQVAVAPGPWRLAVKSDRFLATLSPPGAFARLSIALRGRVLATFAAVPPAPDGGRRPGIALARSLLLGDAAALSETHRSALRRTGLAHLIAVSGFNVSLVALLAGWAALGLPRLARLAVAVFAVLLYLLLVGPAPSVMRATAMALLAITGLAARRIPGALQGLAISAIVLLAFDPGAVRDVGFVLSFSATAGLLLLAPRWAERRHDRLPRILGAGLAATLAAQAASLPWSVATFGELSPLAPLLNLLAVPWAALALAAAILWLGVATVVPAVAPAAALPLDWIASPLDALASLPAGFPVSLCWPGGWISGLAAALPFAAAGEGGRTGRAAGLALVLIVQTGHGRVPEPPFEALFLDVGQGDATLLRRGREALLIDGGGAAGFDFGSRVLLPQLATRGVRRLRLAIVSHADADHCLGVADLAGRLPIDEIWIPRGAVGSPCAAALERAAGRPPRVVAADLRRQIGGFALRVFADPSPMADDNAGSLVVRVDAGGRRLLFPGDIAAMRERQLVARAGAELRADLLHVPHHGSSGSSSDTLLRCVRAPLAVVSAGVDSRYGHPAEAVLARLAAAGTRSLRTDRVGAVRLTWRRRGPWRIELPAAPRALASSR